MGDVFSDLNIIGSAIIIGYSKTKKKRTHKLNEEIIKLELFNKFGKFHKVVAFL